METTYFAVVAFTYNSTESRDGIGSIVITTSFTAPANCDIEKLKSELAVRLRDRNGIEPESIINCTVTLLTYRDIRPLLRDVARYN